MRNCTKINIFKLFLKLVLASPLALVLISCANKNLETCERIIWRKEGQLSALRGEAVLKFNELQKMCKPFKTPINKEAFQEGHEAGLSLFCQEGKGYSFGSNGQVYSSTCSAKTEDDFLNGYYRGRIKYLEAKQKQTKILFRRSEDRVWRKERDYLIEATQDLAQAEQELDLLESYKEEAKSLDLESRKIKLELIQLKKKLIALKFK